MSLLTVPLVWDRYSVDVRLDLWPVGCFIGTPLKEFCRLFMDLTGTLWSVRNNPATSVNQKKFCSRWMFKMPNSTSTSLCCVLSLLSSESAVTSYWDGESRLNDEEPRGFLFKTESKRHCVVQWWYIVIWQNCFTYTCILTSCLTRSLHFVYNRRRNMYVATNTQIEQC